MYIFFLTGLIGVKIKDRCLLNWCYVVKWDHLLWCTNYQQYILPNDTTNLTNILFPEGTVIVLAIEMCVHTTIMASKFNIE